MNGFCAINTAFKTPLIGGYEGVPFAMGCTNKQANFACIPSLGWTDSSATVSQADCMNYGVSGLALIDEARKYTHMSGAPSWPADADGFFYAGAPEIIWFDPSSKQVTYRGLQAQTQTQDASDWIITGKL